MPTSPYFAKDGTPLPGTTTILGRYKDSGGLLFWAHKVGYEQGLARKAARLYEQRDKAADTGTYLHALIEADIKNLPEPKPAENLAAEDVERGRNAFRQFKTWEEQTKLFLVSWERPLVSEEYRFGGTPDALGELDGITFLVDWKSSDGVYPDNLLQLAAYKLLLDENYPQLQLSNRVYVLRFSKNWMDFEHRSFEGLETETRQFIRLREAYADDLIIKRRI